jgi:phage terminase large subunit-like protein
VQTEIDTSCLDWQDRIMSGRSLVPELPLNEEEASRAVRVFNRLRVPDVFGTPRLEEATGDWFRDIVSALFGSYDPDTNRRAIQEVFLLVPKKNGKTTNAAAVMVTAMILNRRPRAELLLIAPTKEISDLAYKQAKGMIQADEALNEIFHCRDHVRSIEHRVHGSELKIKAADTDAITGSKSTFILIDETHVFAGKPRARDVFVEVRGALASRPDGFLFQISTQSKSPPAGVFKAELDRARKVRDGKLRLPILPVIYELPPSERERWDTKKNMERVNPNLGRSLEPSFLTRELATAKEEGPEALALFASQHANKEIGLNLMADRWSGADFWEQAGDRQLTLEEILRRSEVVTIGIDGGGLDDLLGFAVVLGLCMDASNAPTPIRRSGQGSPKTPANSSASHPLPALTELATSWNPAAQSTPPHPAALAARQEHADWRNHRCPRQQVGHPGEGARVQGIASRTLMDRLDEAWESIKLGLVKGLSASAFCRTSTNPSRNPGDTGSPNGTGTNCRR